MSTTPTPAGVSIFTAQIHRPGLRKWCAKLPPEVGASIISEAVTDLLNGDCSSLKGLSFVSRLIARRRRTRTA